MALIKAAPIHADDDFWTRRSGRLGIESDCGLIAPAFAIGSTYLVLLAEPDTKQFEQINTPQDRWLQCVRAHIAAKPSL